MNLPAPPARRASVLSWLLLVLGACGFAAVWVMLSLSNDRQNSWMALLGALDVAWMLRLGGWRPGPVRMAVALLGTLAVVGLANWGIAAAQLGPAFGLTPWESAERLGPHHAWTLTQLANGGADLAWLAAGLVVAALVAR